MLYHSQWIVSFRASKQKLESLLQQWSEWEAEYTSLAQVSLNGEGHLLSS